MEGRAVSGDDLRVTTAHLGDLAVKQGDAAVGIRSATTLVEDADIAVRSTHGAVASASASALAAVLAARRSAGLRMAAISDDLCDKLTDAANRYDRADDAVSGVLRTRMQPEQI
jgi:hypothetical protein